MAENSDSTPSRRTYAKTWIDDPNDPADYDPKTGLLTGSKAQIDAARAEMDADLRTRHWSETVRQYPRTVIGKFHNAPVGGYTEVGFEAGKDQGVFSNRQGEIYSPNVRRLQDILHGAQTDNDQG